jgi:hypothetical protein
MRRFFALALTVFLSTGCASNELPSTTVDGITGFMANRTIMTYSVGHGTQVEYSTANGRTFLWYPGNTRTVSGEWKVEERDVQLPGSDGVTARKVTLICYRYGANTYNPVTNQRGGAWECRPAERDFRLIVESVQGDVFGLAARRTPPFALTRDRMTIADLQRRMVASSAQGPEN